MSASNGNGNGTKRPKKRVGRRSKLTPELRDRICALVRGGNYHKVAAQACGIGQSTLYEWIEKGEASKDKKSEYAEFSEAIKKADAEAESADVLIIKKAAKKSWQAAAWLLERKRFQRWARREKFEHSGPGGGAIRTESKLTIKDIRKIVDHPKGVEYALGLLERRN
jgi:transposase-like protein